MPYTHDEENPKLRDCPEWSFQTSINGDAPDTLIGEFREIMRAAQILQDKISKLTVHGRNHILAEDSQSSLRNDQDLFREMVFATKSIEDYAQNGAIRAIRQKEK